MLLIEFFSDKEKIYGLWEQYLTMAVSYQKKFLETPEKNIVEIFRGIFDEMGCLVLKNASIIKKITIFNLRYNSKNILRDFVT